MRTTLASALAKLIPHYVEEEDWQGLADDLAIYVAHHVDDDQISDIVDEIKADLKGL